MPSKSYSSPEGVITKGSMRMGLHIKALQIGNTFENPLLPMVDGAGHRESVVLDGDVGLQTFSCLQLLWPYPTFA